MSGVFAAGVVKAEKQSEFKPHWLKADRAANDVTPPVPALPLYEWLAGKPAPVVQQVESIKKSIIAKEMKDWSDSIEPVMQAVKRFNPTPVKPERAKEVVNALREFDAKRASKELNEHIADMVGELSQEFQCEVERTIKGLTNGQSIWEKVAGCELYGISLEKNGDDELQVSIDSVDYFQHFYADIASVPETYRPYYAFLLFTLIRSGFGEFQDNVVEYYGSFSKMGEANMAVVREFIKKLKEQSQEEISEVLSEYADSKVIEEFLFEVSDVVTWGEDIMEILQNDIDTGIQYLEDGLEIAEYVEKHNAVMNCDGVSLSALLRMEDESPYMALFKSVAAAHSSLTEYERAVNLMEESTPFGVIISALGEADVSDEVERRIQSVYESYMNNAEDLEAWIVDLNKPDWKGSVKNMMIRTGLVIAMIEGVKLIRNVA